MLACSSLLLCTTALNITHTGIVGNFTPQAQQYQEGALQKNVCWKVASY